MAADNFFGFIDFRYFNKLFPIIFKLVDSFRNKRLRPLAMGKVE